MQNGFSVERIPEQTRKVCRGCKHLDKRPGLRASDHVTDSFYCNHPHSLNELKMSGIPNLFGAKGKLIEYHVKLMPTTPEWCPYIQNPNLKNEEESKQ